MENKRSGTIRTFVDDKLNSFGLKLDGEKFVMTNNEPTMKSTFEFNWNHIGCSDHYLNKQQHLSEKLIAYAETHFSGAYNMLVVFLETFPELTSILDSKLFSHYDKIDKDFLDDVCKFFLPFDTVLQTSSDSKRPALHRVLPFKQLLINKCTIQDDDKEGLKQIKLFLSMYSKAPHAISSCFFLFYR